MLNAKILWIFPYQKKRKKKSRLNDFCCCTHQSWWTEYLMNSTAYSNSGCHITCLLHQSFSLNVGIPQKSSKHREPILYEICTNGSTRNNMVPLEVTYNFEYPWHCSFFLGFSGYCPDLKIYLICKSDRHSCLVHTYMDASVMISSFNPFLYWAFNNYLDKKR